MIKQEIQAAMDILGRYGIDTSRLTEEADKIVDKEKSNEIAKLKKEIAGIKTTDYPKGASDEIKNIIDNHNEPIIAQQVQLEEELNLWL